MRFLNKFSLRRKLTAIVMITCSVAILVACTIFAVYDVTTFKRSLASGFGYHCRDYRLESYGRADFARHSETHHRIEIVPAKSGS